MHYLYSFHTLGILHSSYSRTLISLYIVHPCCITKPWNVLSCILNNPSDCVILLLLHSLLCWVHDNVLLPYISLTFITIIAIISGATVNSTFPHLGIHKVIYCEKETRMSWIKVLSITMYFIISIQNLLFKIIKNKWSNLLHLLYLVQWHCSFFNPSCCKCSHLTFMLVETLIL